MIAAPERRRVRVELRGAPLQLLEELAAREGDPELLEYMLDGPGGTGKSRGIAHVLHWLCMEFPGIRILVVRKFRADLTEAFCKTWEEDVLPEGDPALSGRHKEGRHAYYFDNGSTVVLGGMDKDTRLFSTDYDVVYVQEAIELSEDEWEKFRRALRNFTPGLAFQLIVGDTNPGPPNHWILDRSSEERGAICRLLKSQHHDNPRWYDATARRWTPKGRAYITGLSQLTGIRRQRLYLGEWIAAEGVVWESFNRVRHVISEKDLPELRWHFASVDWGHTEPGVMQVWGVDGRDRLYRVAEVYRTGELSTWWADRAVEFHQKYTLRAIVCDQSRPEHTALFNDRLGSREEDPVARIARPCMNKRSSTGNGDMGGLDIVRDGFAKDRIFLVAGVNTHIDKTLVQLSRPTCTEKEIPEYVFAKRQFTKLAARPQERPTELTDPSCYDHGCDALRYAASFAWRRDMSEDPAKTEYAPWTFGDVLGYGKEPL